MHTAPAPRHPSPSNFRTRKRKPLHPIAHHFAGADGTGSGIPATWIKNAVLTAARPEMSGAGMLDAATGRIDAARIERVPRTRGRLPKLRDLAMLAYLERLGHVDMYQDPTAFEALQLYKDGYSGFYIGTGLEKFTITPSQLLRIREMLTAPNKKGFDAAVSLHIGRVLSSTAAPRETVFGVDVDAHTAQDAASTAQKAADVSGKLATGDYAGAAEDAGGDIAKGAMVGATVAAATGTIVAAGAAIGTAIPIPVVGTAVGAAVGAAVAGAIALGHAIFDSGPEYTEEQYTTMKDACKRNGGEVVYGVPPDQSGACRFPDGFTAGGYDPKWPDERRQWWLADQAARKLQYTNLGSYVNGLKQIDLMFTAADKAMRQKGATRAGRDAWFKRIGDAFAKIYVSTGQDKYAPLDVKKFLNDPFNQKRVFTPPMPTISLAPARTVAVARLKSMVAAPAAADPKAHAGAALTMGMNGTTQAQATQLMTPIAAAPGVRQGAVQAVQTLAVARSPWWKRLLHFLHLT